ncbi:U-box domain-containing protein 19 [Forsythia ovata]|uniref:U-box domain-containing protein 19 n=1 Tax=Forsythia ovata TaxID=205694 RepID=A0ABD1XCN5_9LAMI
MISKSNDFTHQILNFPAICPCDLVCFSNIVNSLIDLCHTICHYKSRTCFTNKKNARDSIRLIEIFLVFLEDIQNGHSRNESTLVLGLSELHFIFQKVQFLLEDCSRDDARIWMLVKLENFSSQFRVLMRSIVVALDVLPVEGLDVSAEVREMFEFVSRQAFKAKFDVEVDDRRVLRKVLRV